MYTNDDGRKKEEVELLIIIRLPLIQTLILPQLIKFPLYLTHIH